VGDLLAEAAGGWPPGWGRASASPQVKGSTAFMASGRQNHGAGYVRQPWRRSHDRLHQGPAFVDVPFLIVEDSAIQDRSSPILRKQGLGRLGGRAHPPWTASGCKFMAMGLQRKN
jgi:hypothetical protein